MTKRAMALITALLMVWVAALPAFAADVPYPDVSSDHWAYEAIEALHNAGLIEGYPDGTFGGERTFTRYEMAMVFSRILRRLDNRMDLLAGRGINVDALLDEFGSDMDLINALTVAIGNAQQEAERAAERAYHARLAATQAQAQGRKAEDTAKRALAIAQEGGVEEARAAAQRAQRVAADAEAAALRATAIAESAFAAVKSAEEAAARARTTGDAEAALDLAMQADRLAYLARLTAERAIETAEEAHARIDELAAAPRLGGEVKAQMKQWSESDPTLNMDVKLTATAQVTEDVKVVGGVELAHEVLGDATEDFDKAKVKAEVTTPGFVRKVAFSREALGTDDRTEDFALKFGLPVSIVDIEFDIGYERNLSAGAQQFRNWRQVGFSDADLLGFEMDFHYYMADRDTGDNAVVRAEASRALELGSLPLGFGFTIANVLEGNPAVGPHFGLKLELKDYALSDAFKVNAGLKFAQNPYDKWTHPETWVEDQVLTANVGAGLDVLGGQLDAEVEIGVVGADHIKADAEFSYPLIDGMDSSVGLEFDSRRDDFAVKAGLGVKF